MKRLRVIDLNTPWFWLVIFYRRQYGEPRLEASVYSSQRHLVSFWRRWWLYGLTWEPEPDRRGAEVVDA